ncbi:MAG TPA: MBL fold metallo-hydrolase, partial [Longimicrobiales bacterium]|nr:MBL fold metallo-hydrolase [Longimicrobiales bacterium]
MFFRQVFDPGLAQYAYLIGCEETGEALVLDPERDVDRYLEAAREEGLRLVAAAETHVHADFLSGCRELADRGCTVYLSDEGGEAWRYRWPEATGADVVLLEDGDVFRVGSVELRALHTPGHTPEHLGFLVTDRGGGADRPMGIASGDFLFVGSLGRPDLLERAAGEVGAMRPAAEALYASLDRLLELDDWLQVWPGHGAGSACGKGLGSVPESTLGYERRFNPSIAAARRGRDAFVESILADQPDPPLYFARMKRLNRDGPPPLGELPDPRRLAPEELAELAGGAVQLLDARADRSAFMAAHLRGSLYASLEEDFATVAGSYLDPDRPVVLVVDEADRDEAVRTLVRVGIDRIEGWATPGSLDALAGERAAGEEA